LQYAFIVFDHMGLDLVELAVRFEEAFGIAIPDEVAAELTTPRRVSFYVLSQLNLAEQTACASQQAFYFLRREFVPALGIHRTDFRPTSNLAELLPVENRKQIWTTVRGKLGDAALPDLVRPRWVFLIVVPLTIVATVTAFLAAASLTRSAGAALFVAVVVFVGAGLLGAILTRSMEREFRKEYANPGDLANYAALHSPHSFKREWTRQEIDQTVRRIIIDQTGVDNFTEDSRFIEDMHLD
jgi:acyl carrier protein